MINVTKHDKDLKVLSNLVLHHLTDKVRIIFIASLGFSGTFIVAIENYKLLPREEACFTTSMSRNSLFDKIILELTKKECCFYSMNIKRREKSLN